MQYHQIFPQSFKEQYSQNDVIDFVMTFEGQSLVAGSVRLTGNLQLQKGSTNIDVTNTDVVGFDPLIGIHGAYQAITCSTDLGGVLENNNAYPLYCKAKATASATNTQYATHSADTAELRCGNKSTSITKALAINNKVDQKVSFAMKPDVAFNKSSDHIPFAKSGVCKMTVRLATNNQFIYGAGNDGTYQYILSDFQLHYRTVPMKGVKALQFDTVVSISNTIESNLTSLANRVPATVQSASCVFIREKNINQPIPNSLALEVPPDVSRVEFSFNDSTTQYVTFVLEDREEILYNYQRSWGFNQKNNITLDELDHEGRGYGIGLPFGQLIDMTNQKFGLTLESGISNVDKYSITMFFRGVVGI